MDKDNNDKGKFIKLDNKERKILRSIDKSSKWEDVKAIKDINEEIINLDIYKDFIGLGCSRYLNESAETGKLDIEDMFRNCREAEKVRVRVKKKERKESSGKAGKAGLGRSNIGQLVKGKEKSIKDIDSKQIKEEPKKESKIINKAKDIAKGITDALVSGVKGNGWKETITKYGLRLGMDTLFGIVIGVMEYSIDNPIGGVAITSTALGLIGSIYSYVSELETGKKVIGDITDFIKSKMNELYNYLLGKDIKVIKKGKKKKPLDKGSSKKDDDDDDDDDDSSEDFSIDFNELQEYSNENEITETEKRTEEEQDLSGETQTKRTTQMNSLETILPFLLQQQSQQQQQNLVNTNTERLFQQNVNNPLPTSTPQDIPQDTPKDIPQEEEPQQQKAENLNPETPQDNTSFMGSIGGTIAGLMGGTYWLNNHLFNTPNLAPQPIPVQPQPVQPQSLTGYYTRPTTQTQSLLPRGSIQPRYNRQDSLTQTDITQTNLTPDQEAEMENSRKKLREQAEQLKQEEKRKQEQSKKINEAIEDMDLRGRAWGLVNPASSGTKMATDSLSSLLMGIGVMERARTQQELRNNIITNVNFRTQQEEQMGLLQDIETQAEQSRINAMENARQNQLLDSENDRLRAELSLIRAREGQEEERKMTAKEAEVYEEQQKLETKRKQEKELKEFEALLREQEAEKEREELERIRGLIPQIRAPTRIDIQELEEEETTLGLKQSTTDTGLGEVSIDTGLAQEVITGRSRGRPPNPDIVLIQDTLGLERITGRLPSGAVAPNEIKFSSMEANTRKLPKEVRDEIMRIVREDKANARRTNRSKLSPKVAKEIADLIRRFK
jgi:hypothetical protein